MTGAGGWPGGVQPGGGTNALLGSIERTAGDSAEAITIGDDAAAGVEAGVAVPTATDAAA